MTKPKLTADAAYENAHQVAQDLVERIRELLFDLPVPGNDEHPIHWGHVGSINEITKRLSSVVAFLNFTRSKASLLGPSATVGRGVSSGRGEGETGLDFLGQCAQVLDRRARRHAAPG